MENQAPEKFEGWAIVEIMGHRTVSGFVTTIYYGPVAFFRIQVPEMQPETITLPKQEIINNRVVAAGTKVRAFRTPSTQEYSASAIYGITRCAQELALAQAGYTYEVIDDQLRLPIVLQEPKPEAEVENEPEEEALQDRYLREAEEEQ